MFHIVFNADQNYMKYVAVLITNITHYTDTSKKFTDFAFHSTDSKNKTPDSNISMQINGGGGQSPITWGESLTNRENPINAEQSPINLEGYHFHVITDSITKKTLEQFHILQTTLNDIYPCQIEAHIINDEDFKDLPKWGYEEAQQYAAYYRIKLVDFLPKNVDKCLYLDIDMLVLTDLREIFAFNLDGYIAASSSGSPNAKISRYGIYRKKKGGKKAAKSFETSFYFCSGLMLINTKEWIKQNVDIEAMRFLREYETEFADQDALNFAMRDRVYNLGEQWGILAYQSLEAACSTNIDFSKRYEKAMINAKILHCNGPAKAWFGAYNKLTIDFMPNIYPHKDVWCKMARLCSGFENELNAQVENIENEGLPEYAIALARQLREFQGHYNFPAMKRRLERISKPHKAIMMALKNLIHRFKKHV